MENQNKNELNRGEGLVFLLEEFKECLSHMRHYDNAKLSLAKFGFSFYSAVAAVVYTLERYFFFEVKKSSIDFFVGGLLVLSFLIGLMMMIMVIRLRKYFVRVARQVNEIRRYFVKLIEVSGMDFADHLYTSREKPVPFNPKSTYLLLSFLFTGVNSIALAFSSFFVARHFHFCSMCLYGSPILLFAASLIGQLIYTRLWPF